MMNKYANRSLCVGMGVLVLWVLYYSFQSYGSLVIKEITEKDFEVPKDDYELVPPHQWRGCPSPNKGAKSLVVVSQYGGRLGNHIWEYLSSWAVARHFGMWPASTTEGEKMISKYFEDLSAPTLEGLASRCDMPWLLNQYANGSSIHSRKELLERVEQAGDLDRVTVLRLPFFLVLTEELAPWWRELRRELRLKAELRQAAQEQLWKIREQVYNASTKTGQENLNATKSLEFVGVHVRRSDYLSHVVSNYPGARAADERFFLNAMRWLRERLKRPLAFVVASDDVAWCREHLARQPDVFVTGDGNQTSPGYDLALLGACNHTIFSYGTFSLTAAVLANGRYTLLYDTQNGTNTKEMEFATFLPGWHILDDNGNSHYDAASNNFKLTYVKG